MKKFTKRSLIAALSLTSLMTNVSADNLADAFSNGKVKGEIKAVYSDSNKFGLAKSDEVTTAGGSLNYVSGSYYGLITGVTFQTSHIVTEDNNNGVFKDDLDASGSVLSELYIDYKLSNTSVKVGRQFIYTPLVSTAIDGKASESILKDSFEAYVLTNTDIPDTTIVAAYIDKYQAKATVGDIGSFEQLKDGAYTFYAKNTSIKDLTLQAQYLKVNAIANNHDKEDLYFQADYQLSGHTLSAQYLESTNNGKDGQFFGLKAMGPLGISNLGYIVASSTSTKDGNVDGEADDGEGTGRTDTPFTAMPVNGGDVVTRANTDTLVGAIIIPINNVTFIPYGGKSFSKIDPIGDVTAFGAMAIYPINKNLLVKVIHEHVKIEKLISKNTDTSRVYLSYSF